MARARTRADTVYASGTETPWLEFQIDPPGYESCYLLFPANRARARTVRRVYLKGLGFRYFSLRRYNGPVRGRGYQLEICTHPGKGCEYVCIRFDEEDGDYTFLLRNVQKAIRRVRSR